MNTLKTSNLIYDPMVNDYGFDIERSTTEYLKYKLVKKYTNPRKTVLDIGCANGLYSIPLSSYAKNIVGIDISPRMIDLFKEKISNLKIKNIEGIERDALDIDKFGLNEFDLVFSYSSLVLIPNLHIFFEKLPKIIKEEGVVILDITGKYNLSQRFWKRWYQKQGHYTLNAFSKREIIKLLKDLGFDVIESHALGFCDQWKYLPIIKRFASKLNFMDRIFHHKIGNDLDYKISNLSFIQPLANRWLIVAQKI